MASFAIVGTGSYLPGRPYSNHDLARVMDTTDEWVVQRTGISQRHYAGEGIGATDLALEASRRALAAAKLASEDLDYILFATMTPDHIFPGSAPVLGARLGAVGVPALDIRQQCAASLYGLDLADALFASGKATRILFVGSEVHAGFMPWTDWNRLDDPDAPPVSRAAWERANQHRALAILFGDGAGAWVLQSNAGPGRGLLAIDLHADGNHMENLFVPAGFRRRPYIDQETLDKDLFMPRMNGRELFKHAVTKLPKSVKTCCKRAGVELKDIDLFVAHQANQRINEAIRNALELPSEKVPSNIARVGNTSAGTIPILYDELVRSGQVEEGMLVCFLALGAGIHWGSLLFRV